MGGMISTADTNIPGAEGLVRNRLMGLRWFKEHMNAVPQTGWLFDTFGLSAQLPQKTKSIPAAASPNTPAHC